MNTHPMLWALLISTTTLFAQNFALASATPESSQAGKEILEKGGNAADAAIAIAFTLGVTEPAMSGIGGRTMMIVSIPNQDPVAIGGISLTPSYVEKGITKDKLLYHKQITIPSQVKILGYLYKHYASKKLSWAELLDPAIRYAEEGFVVGTHRHQVFSRYAEKLKKSPYHNGEVLIDGAVPAIGELLKQPTLAHTLRRLATHGAEDFYSGSIARDIAKDMQDHGGWITLDDLKNFPEPKEMKPLHTTYRGYDVYSFNPPGGGWQVLQALNIMERIPQSKISTVGIERKKAILQALNISHQDRLDFPIQDYVNYHKEVSQKISKEYTPIDPLKTATTSKTDAQAETTHFSVVDKDGMALSVTSSIGAYYGAQVATKNLGFFYNSYAKSLMGFGLKGKGLEPGVIVPSSMSPSLVKKDGKNKLIIGTPGSKRIVSTISQLIQLWIDSDLSITDIIKLPRVHAIRNTAYVENLNHQPQLLKALRSLGFQVVFPNYDLTIDNYNAYFGGVHAIEFKHNKWVPAADPRRDGTSISEN